MGANQDKRRSKGNIKHNVSDKDISNNTTELRTTYDYAMFYISNDLSVIPIKPRDKVPLVEWGKYQEQAPSISELQKWFKNTDNNIAIVTGKISGNLIVIDFDDGGLYKEFLEKLSDDLKEIINNTWIVKTSRGYHVYLRVDSDKSIRTTKLRHIDIKAEGGYVLAPSSIHPSGIRYEFTEPNMPYTHVIRKISIDQLDKIQTTLLKILETRGDNEGGKPSLEATNETPKPGNGTTSVKDQKPEGGITNEAPEPKSEVEAPKGGVSTEGEKPAPEVRNWRELKNNQILGIVKTLQPFYKTGLRHDIILFLAGWLYKAGIKYESAEGVIKAICEEYNDEECNDRLYALRDTYGIGRPLREEVLKQKGKTLATKGGLYKVLKDAGINEDEIITLIKKLEEILEAPEPSGGFVVELLDYEKETFAVLNFYNCEVVTAQKIHLEDGNYRLVKKSKVILGCPESITFIAPPYSQIPKFDIIWNIPSQNRKLSLEGVTVDEIMTYLKLNALVLQKNNAENILNAILNAMIRKGLAEIKNGYEAPGFYWVNGRLIANKVDVRKPHPQELREALELLNELTTNWFSKVQPQFITAIKLGILMPFSFAIKQKFRNEKGFIPWLYLYGETNTGKSTTGDIILRIFGVSDNDHIYLHGHVNTEAKLGAKLALDTFPKVVNEAMSLFDIQSLVEIIKGSVEGLVARQRFESKSIIREYPALSALILTAQHMRITDPALTQKRLVILRYPISARQPNERIEEFMQKVSGRLPKLGALGQFIASYLIEHPEELTYDWVNLSTKLLQKAYEYAGITPAFDLKTLYIDVEEYDPRLDIILSLWNKLQEAFMKKIDERDELGRKVIPKEPYDLLKKVLENHAIDFMIKYGEDEVFFTSKILEVLKSEKIIIDSMHALAELFADYGFRYEVRKIAGKATRVVSVRFDDLVRLFSDYFDNQKPQQQPLI